MSDLGFDSNCKHVKLLQKNTQSVIKSAHKATRALEAAANSLFEVSSALSEMASMHNFSPNLRANVEQLHNRLRFLHGGQSIGQLKMNEQREFEWPAKEMEKNVEKVLRVAADRRDEADRVKKYEKDLNKMEKYQQHSLQLNQHDFTFQCAVNDLNLYAEMLLLKFTNTFTQSHSSFLIDLINSLEPASHASSNAMSSNNNNTNINSCSCNNSSSKNNSNYAVPSRQTINTTQYEFIGTNNNNNSNSFTNDNTNHYLLPQQEHERSLLLEATHSSSFVRNEPYNTPNQSHTTINNYNSNNSNSNMKEGNYVRSNMLNKMHALTFSSIPVATSQSSISPLPSSLLFQEKPQSYNKPPTRPTQMPTYSGSQIQQQCKSSFPLSYSTSSPSQIISQKGNTNLLMSDSIPVQARSLNNVVTNNTTPNNKKKNQMIDNSNNNNNVMGNVHYTSHVTSTHQEHNTKVTRCVSASPITNKQNAVIPIQHSNQQMVNCMENQRLQQQQQQQQQQRPIIQQAKMMVNNQPQVTAQTHLRNTNSKCNTQKEVVFTAPLTSNNHNVNCRQISEPHKRESKNMQEIVYHLATP